MTVRVDFKSVTADKVLMTMVNLEDGRRYDFTMDMVGLQELADLANAAVLQSRGFVVAHA